jgi:hypothetical protein
MAGKKLSRNAPCPCGSGKKYKHCCLTKGFDWVEGEDGTIQKSVPLSAEAVAILQEQRRKFVETFGREPGPTDPVFFDVPPVEQIEFQTVQAMRKAGIDEAIIYAYEKTGGLLVTEQNRHLITDKDLAAWQAAIEEYEERHRGPEAAGG